jgi:protein-L-isoaspartate O-methyltransferase
VSDWRQRAAALAGQLAALEGVDPQWVTAFAEVPRHVFVPRFYPDLDAPEAVDGADPDRQQEWLGGVYSDESLVTQYRLTPGTTDLWQSTSSSTRPSLMARMLTLLDVHDSHRVLEIGTGTGYNAALLCHRLGSDNVASLDIDAELVDTARQRLAALGFHPTLTTGDGAAGLAAHAPTTGSSPPARCGRSRRPGSPSCGPVG